MGGKSTTTVKQRELSAEEKQLYAQQVQYMQSIQPGINALINKGMSGLNNTYNPDWNNIADTYSSNINDIMGKQNTLLNGELPSAWTNSKQNYYNQLYENTVGKSMSDMAKNGVINSSRMNTSSNDWQKNLATQMSKDYTSDVNTYNNLLNTRESWLQDGVNDNATMAQQSRKAATDYFDAATGAQSANSTALNSISNNNNSRSYTQTSTSGGFGSFLGGLASVGSSFLGK